MPWNPDTYLKFAKERYAPYEDLFAMITAQSDLQVIDLGCGTGELTRRLADALPSSEVIGLDNSATMLSKAEAFVRPGVQFKLGSIEEITGQWDLVFSHAAIQWVDDHEHLISKLLSLVKPGGQLAVQLPSNHDHISHQAIRQLAAESPFRDALQGWIRRIPVLRLEQYADLLHQAGGQDLNVIEKVYPHILADADAVADWTSGTALVPYFERLPADLRDEFMNRYRAILRQQFPSSPVFYPFKRILFTAVRG